MKTFIAAASFALTLGLSGLAHAGFNDRGPTIDTTPARAVRQDLSQTPVVRGFNQKNPHTETANPAPLDSRDLITLGANCDLSPRLGFQNSSSSASC